MKNFIFGLVICLLLPAFGCSSMKSVEDDMTRFLKHMEIDSLAQKPAGKDEQPAGETPQPPAPATDSLKKAASSADGNHSLTIQAFPKESTIRVMNIKSRYYPGIRLPSGNYDVLVEYPGYKPYRQWVNVEYDLIMKVILKETGEAYISQSFDPAPPEADLGKETVAASEMDTVTAGETPPDAEASPGSVGSERAAASGEDTDANGFPTLLSGHYGSVSALCFSPDGKLLASGGYDSMVILWNTGDGSVARHLNHEDRVTAVAFSPDGSKVASAGSDRSIKLWSVGSGELLKTITGHTTRIHSLAFDLSGEILISGGDNELILWDAAAGKIKTLIVGDDRLYPLFGSIREIAIHPGGGDWQGYTFAFACKAGISLFNPLTKQLITIDDAAPPYSVTYSPDGNHIAWGARHYHQQDEFFPRIVVTDTKQKDPLLSRDDDMAKADRVFYTRYTPDGGRLIMLTYNQAVLYDIKAGNVVRKFTGTSETAVTDAALSPDGRILAATAKDQIRVWKIEE